MVNWPTEIAASTSFSTRVPPWTGARRTTYTATSKINVKTEMWTAIHWPDGKNRKWNTCTVQRPSVLIRWTRNGAIQQLESISRWPDRNVCKRDQLNAPGERRKPQSNNNQLGKTQRCRNWDWGPQACDQCPEKKRTCHYCQDLAKVCLSNLRKKSVHEIEASSSNNASTKPELTEQLSDWVFLPAKQNSWWLRAES